MGDAVGADPLPENVDGSIVEKHVWNHEVSHSVQWDYVLMALVALLVVWYVFVRSPGDVQLDNEGDDEAAGWP